MTPINEDASTSMSTSGLRVEFLANGDDKSYRQAYADENLNILIATQLKVLREQREWTQEELANEAEMQQPMISRYESVNYSSWSINTLKKLAAAFDVWLDVRFRSYGDLVTTVEGFNRKSLEVPRFADDPFFKDVPAIAALNVFAGAVTSPVTKFAEIIPIDRERRPHFDYLRQEASISETSKAVAVLRAS